MIAMHDLSIWEKETWYSHQDILIVGAGLMGLWSALELKKSKPSLRITIIERNTTPLGASTRNAGFACFGSPTELIHNASAMGIDAMLQIVDMRHKGIEKIKANFTTEEIGFDPCGGYECINRDYKGWGELNDKIHWLNGLLKPITGKEQSFTRTDEKISQQGLKGFDALIENVSEASLHSGMLVQSLTKKVQSAGVSILYGVDIKSWGKQNGSINVVTHEYLPLSCNQLLFCTNAFTDTLLPELAITPGRGQVIVTSPIQGLAMKGTFHFEEGFYYWRNLGNRILLGGARNTAFEEETTVDLSGSEKIKEALLLFLKEHLNPSYQYTIDHHWSGIMGFTESHQPVIKQISEGIFASIACNGMGVALTPIIAEKAAALLLTHF
jgi:glycine/D-amino acid oxidase-like deaminating enzyme